MPVLKVKSAPLKWMLWDLRKKRALQRTVNVSKDSTLSILREMFTTLVVTAVSALVTFTKADVPLL